MKIKITVLKVYHFTCLEFTMLDTTKLCMTLNMCRDGTTSYKGSKVF